ncbi:MAG TPA: hypothetical protein VNT25_04530 [Allosphingosinicella sp.]|nr:hypothetical protein [Allosphingosinicella sp.]
MRNSIKFIAVAAAALAAGPALAQLGVGLGAKVGAGVNAGGVVDGVTGTVDRTVSAADRAVNRTLSRDLVLATRADLRTGAEVRDSSGKRVGTVQSVHGNMAVIVQGNRTMRVPLASIYRSGKGLVTSLTRAQLRASADAQANASVRR